MEQRKLKQQDVAELCGIDPGAISRFVAGITEPRLSILVRLAVGLGVPVNKLVEIHYPRPVEIHFLKPAE